jgi:predicted PurR-regulated permease PerM
MSAIERTQRRSAKPGTEAIVQERPRIQTLCLVFLSLAAAVFLLRYAQAVILPVVVSLLFFYALDPIVSWVSRFGVPRILSCVILLTAILGTGATAIYLLRGQAAEMVERLPEALRKARAAIESQQGKSPGAVAKVQQAAGELEKTASRVAGSQPKEGVTRVQVEEPVFRIGDYLWSGSMGLAWLIGQTITVFFLVFFLLAAGDSYKKKLLQVVGPRLSRQRLTLQILNEINHQIGRFLLVQVLTSTLIGTALGISLRLLGLNQPAVWGVAAGILNFVPYFGTIIVTSAVALVAFLQFGTLDRLAVVTGVTLVVTSLDAVLLTPLLTSKFSNMNNVAVFLSLLFWGWLWGPMGMLLAVPVMVVFKSICDHVDSLKPIAHLLGDAHDGT